MLPWLWPVLFGLSESTDKGLGLILFFFCQLLHPEMQVRGGNVEIWTLGVVAVVVDLDIVQ